VLTLMRDEPHIGLLGWQISFRRRSASPMLIFSTLGKRIP
jgi:hypothetical protein